MAETIPPAADAFLHVRDLTKQYPGSPRPAVDRASFDLGKGRMLALLGSSGCGKTTLLRMIAGLVPPQGGHVMLGGRDMGHVPLHQRQMGMVFQSYALFPHMDVARNVGFGLEMKGMPASQRNAAVRRMLELTHLENLADRRISALSGGQQQRVALARALATEPALLLLDEPLANLDVKLREAMRAEIRALQKRMDVTCLFVTHDQDEALSTADEIAVMSEGVIQQIGTPQDIYERPANRFVAGFIGRANFLPALWQRPGWAEVPELGLLAIAEHERWQGTRTLMVRPHAIRVRMGGDMTDALRACTGHVVDLSYTGGRYGCQVRVGPYLMETELEAGTRLPIRGQEVQLDWPAHRTRVLDGTP
ncbi:ABC transporter ATP-binding protein [Komagataeibacter nataicola]|uniref:ABC transporter ATP-binding protein n=1 Tax=Komagataeibacter nataicola TaxID=265960 RepID=UPI001F27A690|nr:ABC transporter ATP-binding protein [Komagataeibacter nataicola]WEQ54500.1 ABC transporter ATP-binding protein [Komagataeibacter nataicola]WNM08878.1 ABC transporter ATP-binding protein [Komagataeibacter nataicola]GBR21471.1 nitrate/sulfonate/bicarbonate transporter ATP-binding protein [Komagataeibacter nataicola NRIC 0616]